MLKTSSGKSHFLSGDTTILTDVITKAELIKEFLGVDSCGYEALFLALQNVGIKLHTDQHAYPRYGQRQGWCMSVVINRMNGLTTKLYDNFCEAVAQAVVFMEIGGEETEYASEQRKCRLFADYFCKATESIFGFAHTEFTRDSQNSFYEQVRKSRSAATSTMYTDGLYFWEIQGDGTEITAIIHRLLISGQSCALNKLYKLFLNILHYNLVTLFVNRFQKKTQQNYIFNEGSLILTVDGQPAELVSKLCEYILDINYNGVLSGYLSEIVIQGPHSQLTGRMPQFFESLCEHGGGLILIPNTEGLLIKQLVRKGARNVAYMDIPLVKYSPAHSSLFKIFCQNSRVFGSIYAMCGDTGGHIDYAGIADRFAALMAGHTAEPLKSLMDVFLHDAEPNRVGRDIVQILEDCVTHGVKSLMAYCGSYGHNSISYRLDDDESVSELISELIINQGDNGPVNDIADDVYSMDKIDFPNNEILTPTKSLSGENGGRLDRFFVEFLLRGPGNLGGMIVRAVSFDDNKKQPAKEHSSDVIEFVTGIVLPCIKSPVARANAELFIVHLEEREDIDVLVRFLRDVYGKVMSEILPEVNSLDGWFTTIYRTCQKTPYMQKLRTSILKDNDALRSDFLGRYIKHVKELLPDMVLKDFVSFAAGDAGGQIISIAEESFHTVMQKSDSTMTMILDAAGKLDKFEGAEKHKAIVFMEDKIFIDRLNQFGSWVDVLGSQLTDEVNLKLSLDFTDFLGLGNVATREMRSRVDGESYIAERQGCVSSNNLSDAALVDTLLESLCNICGASVGSE